MVALTVTCWSVTAIRPRTRIQGGDGEILPFLRPVHAGIRIHVGSKSPQVEKFEDFPLPGGISTHEIKHRLGSNPQRSPDVLPLDSGGRSQPIRIRLRRRRGERARRRGAAPRSPSPPGPFLRQVLSVPDLSKLGKRRYMYRTCTQIWF